MSEPTVQYQYLARKPGSVYRQMFIKDRRISARGLYGAYMRAEDPMTIEQIAEDRDLPIEAVVEAIEWCKTDPIELRQDFAYDDALMEASGMNEPGYKYNPRPRDIPLHEYAEIRRRIYG